MRILDHLFNAEAHVANNRRFAAQIDTTIVPSPELFDALVQQHGTVPESIAVIPTAPNLNTPLRAGLPADTPDWKGKFVVSYFGRLSEEKAPTSFVEIADRLRSLDDVVFCLCGEGPEAEAVRKLVKARDLGHRIWMPGVLLEVRPLIGRSNVVVLPSVLDGMPNILLEAQMLGTPVVASRVGGVPSMVLDGETGVLCDPRDIEGFATAIRRLHDDPELRRRMGERSRRWVAENFSFARMIASYLALLDPYVTGRVDNRAPAPQTLTHRDQASRAFGQ